MATDPAAKPLAQMALEDRVAIRELLETYNDAVFANDGERWADCWDQDAAWAVAGREVKGRAAILACWHELMAGFAHAAMFVNLARLEGNGSHAQGRVTLMEHLAPKAGGQLSYLSFYDDRYVRGADGRWRFAERRYSIIREMTA